MSAPRDLDEGVAVALEQTRAHRAALTRGSSFAADSLHRLLRCTRCHRWNLDTRAFAGSLQLADGGRRACRDLAELVSIVASQHRALHREDKVDPCVCGAPPLALSLRAARFFHGVPGSGAELIVELRYAHEAVAAIRVARASWDGPVAYLTDATDEAVAQAFMVPLSTVGPWRAALSAPDGAVVAIEEGLSIAAFGQGQAGLRASIDEALASDPDLRAYGLTAKVVSDPTWQWLRDDASLRERPDTVLVMLLRHDVMTARVAVLAARHGLGARREGDTVWVEDGLARWPVDLPTVIEEGFRRGYTLSTMAAAAVALCRERIEAIQGFVAAVEGLRPGVTFAAQGMLLTPTHEGAVGRPFDLRVAPFGGVADADTLERDLRFHFNESPPWADPRWVCPCGAARWVAERVLYDLDLDAMPGGRADVVALGPFGDAGATAVLCVECDRHVDYAVGPLVDGADGGLAGLRGRVGEGLARFERGVRVAEHADAAGRRLALVEGAAIVDAVAHPRLRRGLAEAVIPGAAGVAVEVLHRDLVLLCEEGAEPALASQLAAAGPVIVAMERGHAPPGIAWRGEVDPGATPAGRFPRRGE
ncbi:MAG: hypothetical protein Q7V43_34915 [Myxococcales bacterium]|nr:hypothetical protein [Myxococcales bacterium]